MEHQNLEHDSSELNKEKLEMELHNYFYYESNLIKEGFQPIDVKFDYKGISVAVRFLNEKRDSNLAMWGEYAPDIISAGNNAVELMKKVQAGEYIRTENVELSGVHASVEEVNNHINAEVKSGYYAGYENLECVSVFKGSEVQIHATWIRGEAIVGISHHKTLPLNYICVYGENVIKNRIKDKGKDNFNFIKDFSSFGLGQLSDKTYSYLTEKTTEAVSLTQSEELKDLEANCKVIASRSFTSKDTVYTVILNHKFNPNVMGRNTHEFDNPLWSYYEARNDYKATLEKANKSTQKQIESDKELKYHVRGLPLEYGETVRVIEIYKRVNFKKIAIGIPEFPSYINRISGEGADWNEAFSNLHLRYQEVQEHLMEESQKKKDKDVEPGWFNVTGMPSGLMFDIMEAKSEEERRKIIYEYAQKILERPADSRFLPHYFTAEVLEDLIVESEAKEDYELAAKLRDEIAKRTT